MGAFRLFPDGMTGLFLATDTAAAQIAVHGLPLFACAFLFFIFNLTAIGYYQSVKKVVPSIVFALLRGLVFLVPAFIVMPAIAGTDGIWLSLGVSEFLTTIAIIVYYLTDRRKKPV